MKSSFLEHPYCHHQNLYNLLHAELGPCRGTPWGSQFDNHGDQSYERRDGIGDGEPSHEPALLVMDHHREDLPRDAVAHEGHQG